MSSARERAEQLEWNTLKNSNDPNTLVALADFVGRCRGSVCGEARTHMNALKAEDEEWVTDLRSKTVEELHRYTSRYPQGRYISLAREEIMRLSDETVIRNALQAYEQAYNHRDLAQLVLLWPTFPPQAQQRTRELFKTAKSINMTLSLGDPKITGNLAEVSCKRTRDIVGADEGGGSIQDSVVFRLSKQNDRWIIESGPR